MLEPDAKDDLHRYLQSARDAVLWKLDGLSEYDIRRPMVRTGTNLLGLVKRRWGPIPPAPTGSLASPTSRSPVPRPFAHIVDTATDSRG
jgi:Protein of unknown function (DUF664)